MKKEAKGIAIILDSWHYTRFNEYILIKSLIRMKQTTEANQRH